MNKERNYSISCCGRTRAVRVLLPFLLALCPLWAWADEWTDPETNVVYTYEPGGSTAAVKAGYDSYPGSPDVEGDIVIKSKITIDAQEYTVTSIGGQAFWCCTSLILVTIPESVTSIGYDAFSCSGLTTITIPSSVTSIETTIYSGPFRECDNLEKIMVEAGNPVYDSREDCNAIIRTDDNTLIAGCKSTTIPESVTSIGEAAFDACCLTSINIPESVESIGASAFMFSDLTSVTLPGSVKTIGSVAFSGSDLTSVTIPSSVETFEDAFRDCWNLTSVIIEEGVGVIQKSAFSSCNSLESVTIPESVTSIGDYAFRNCSSLTSITIPEGMTSIGYNAFQGCSSLTSVTSYIDETFAFGTWAFDGINDACVLFVPAGTRDKYLAAGWTEDVFKGGVVEMGGSDVEVIDFADAKVKELCVANWDADGDGELSYDEAAAVTELGTVFKGNTQITSFDELHFFTGLTSIGEEAFYYCGLLESIIIPSSVTSIGRYAFGSCEKLVTIEFPEGVTSIEPLSFSYCYGLTSLVIPKNVTQIGSGAFDDCTGLTSIVVDAENTVYDSRENCNAIIKTSSNELIKGCCNAFIPTSVTIIGPDAFKRSNIASIDIPSSVTSIGYSAFWDCDIPTSLFIPSSVTQISQSAFAACSSISSIVVDADNTVYDSRNNCNAIIETQSNKLIAGCVNTVIPSSVISIGTDAFVGCTGLTSVVIPEGVITIEHDAFEQNGDITSIEFPSSLTSIGDRAFCYAFNLASVTVHSSTPPAASAGSFLNIARWTTPTCILYVPKGCKETYETEWGWWNECFGDIKEMEDEKPGSWEQIVMERKYLVHHGGTYNESCMFLNFGDNKGIYVAYLDTEYWEDYDHSMHGIYIITDHDWKHPNLQDNTWYISPTILDEWVTEKLIVNKSGSVQYYVNGEYKGEKTFNSLDLGKADSLIFEISPWGWWTGHYMYMDDFKVTIDGIVIINDDFNDGVINLDLWRESVNPDGVREEDGIVKMEQLRTDQDFNMYTNPIPLKSNLTDGLVAYYPFNGNANDESGHGYHATPCNNYQYEDGIAGGCITVEGEGYMESSGGHVLLPQFDLDTSSGVTLSLWVKALGLTDSDGECYIGLGNHGGDSVDGLGIIQSSNYVSFYYHAIAVPVPYLEDYTGNWVMYVLTCGNDGKLKAYINGALVGEETVDYDGQINTSLAALGRHWWYDSDATSTRFNGSFDEVRIYNRALTDDEIATLAKYADKQTSSRLTLFANGHGKVSHDDVLMSGDEEELTVENGTEVVLTLTPDLGYTLAQVTKDGADITDQVTDGQLTLTVTGTTMLAVTFGQDASLTRGDANADGDIDVADIAVTASHVVGRSPKRFVQWLADVNEDEEVSVADMVGIVGIITGTIDKKDIRHRVREASYNENEQLTGTLEGNLISICIDEAVSYTAFQMAVTLPEGLTADEAQVSSNARRGHAVVKGMLDERRMMVLVYSTDNRLLGGEGEVLRIQLPKAVQTDIVADRIEFVKPDGQVSRFAAMSIGNLTGIGERHNSQFTIHNEAGAVYDLSGRKMVNGRSVNGKLSKGLYISNGKKVIVR